MTFETLDEFKDIFKTEQDCIDYLVNLRWRENMCCPYCGGNKKIYTFKTGDYFKCSECRNKFSITTKTFLHQTKVKLKQWFVSIYLFIDNYDGVSANLLKQEAGIAKEETAYYMCERIERLAEGVAVNGRNKKYVFEGICRNIFKLKLEYKKFKRETIDNDFFECKIDNISDPIQQKALIKYIRRRIKFSRWIWVPDFISPNEIMADLYIYLAENNISEYDRHFILKTIILLIQRSWVGYYKSNLRIRGRVEKQLKKYSREWKAQDRKRLGDLYITERIYDEHKGLISRYDIRSNKELINNKREKIKKHRITNDHPYPLSE